MYLVLRCKCKFGTKDNGLILLTLIILVFFDNLFSFLFLLKKRPIPRNRDGDVFKHEKNPQRKYPFVLKKVGLKNGPVIIISFTKGLRSN